MPRQLVHVHGATVEAHDLAGGAIVYVQLQRRGLVVQVQAGGAEGAVVIPWPAVAESCPGEFFRA